MVWVVVVVVLVVLVAAAVLMRRRSLASPVAPTSPAPPAPARAPRPPDPPMTGLESALAAVTDREGRPIGERIEAEAQHVDDLRVPDDTGPLLRRALDHVEHHEPQPGPPPDDPATGPS